MSQYEYKVIPSPRKAKRAKGVKGPAARFAYVVEETMNDMAAEGWEFLRAETLPVDEKPGLFSSSVETFQTVFVFRRALGGLTEVDAPISVEAPLPVSAPVAAPVIPPVGPATQMDEPPLTAREALVGEAPEDPRRPRPLFNTPDRKEPQVEPAKDGEDGEASPLERLIAAEKSEQASKAKD